MARVIAFDRRARTARPRRRRRTGGWRRVADIATATLGLVLVLGFAAAWLRAGGPVLPASAELATPTAPAPIAARFAPCTSGADPTCVTDGDTFRYAGTRIRIADIDTPETVQAQCAAERRLADRATLRLTQLLNAGPFTLRPADRDEDRYGRKLRIVTRDGQSLGAVLVAEGLARRWDGARHPWC